jgi:2-alkyl-3-oxoalkanoate reductase
MLTNKWIFVTGSTGFLGSHLLERLSSQGCRVRALARRPERAASIGELAGVELVAGDVMDLSALREAMAGCAIVFHVAAAFSGVELQSDVNIRGTHNVATAAADVGAERMVHVSSIAVYGYRQYGDITEASPTQANHDPYSWTKARGEKEVQRVSAERSLEHSIIRPGMIYGPRSGMWTGRLFELARRRPTLFLGDGHGSCFPIHVDDVIDLMLILATHPAAAGETFNCTPDPSPTWREFLGEYSALAGHDRWFGIPPWLIRPAAELVGRFAPKDHPLRDLPAILTYGQQRTTYKTDKARELLGWQPKVSLQEGIAGCRDWLGSEGLL